MIKNIKNTITLIAIFFAVNAFTMEQKKTYRYEYINRMGVKVEFFAENLLEAQKKMMQIKNDIRKKASQKPIEEEVSEVKIKMPSKREYDAIVNKFNPHAPIQKAFIIEEEHQLQHEPLQQLPQEEIDVVFNNLLRNLIIGPGQLMMQ